MDAYEQGREDEAAGEGIFAGQERISLEPIPVKEGSRVTNDPLQVALAQYHRERQKVDYAIAVEQERKAYEILQKAEAHLKAVTDYWNECQTRMWAAKPED